MFVSLEALVEHYKKWSMVDNSGQVVSLKVCNPVKYYNTFKNAGLAEDQKLAKHIEGKSSPRARTPWAVTSPSSTIATITEHEQ